MTLDVPVDDIVVASSDADCDALARFPRKALLTCNLVGLI